MDFAALSLSFGRGGASAGNLAGFNYKVHLDMMECTVTVKHRWEMKTQRDTSKIRASVAQQKNEQLLQAPCCKSLKTPRSRIIDYHHGFLQGFPSMGVSKKQGR